MGATRPPKKFFLKVENFGYFAKIRRFSSQLWKFIKSFPAVEIHCSLVWSPLKDGSFDGRNKIGRHSARSPKKAERKSVIFEIFTDKMYRMFLTALPIYLCIQVSWTAQYFRRSKLYCTIKSNLRGTHFGALCSDTFDKLFS